jgi:hypothetical protein
MDVEVVSFVAYVTRPPWSPPDRHAIAFIRAAKGQPASRDNSRLDAVVNEHALDWFGKMAAVVLKMKRVDPPIILIPMPNSDCYIGCEEGPRTIPLANAIINHLRNATVIDAMRWRACQTPAHEGGARDPETLYRALVLLLPIPEKGTVIIVDDVLTTGAHALAAAAKVSTERNPCRLAICLGRTVWQQHDRSFFIFRTKLTHAGWPRPQRPIHPFSESHNFLDLTSLPAR